MGDERHLRWQFLDHPHAIAGAGTLLLWNDTKIVGHAGWIPARTKMGNRILLAGWGANFIVSEEFRERGGSVFLLREAMKRFSLLLTSGYNENAAPVLRGLGWKLLPSLTRWVGVLRSDRLGLLPANPDPPEASSIEVRPITRFEVSWDAVWNELRVLYPCTTERDSAYLNWRFVSHPFNRYHLFGAYDGSRLRGFAALRMEKAPELAGARIVDFISAPEAEVTLARGIIEAAGREGADFADFFASGPWHGTAFRKAGFLPANGGPYAEVPAFLLPVNRRRRDITFAVWYAQEVRGDDWYVVKADGDKDRAQNL